MLTTTDEIEERGRKVSWAGRAGSMVSHPPFRWVLDLIERRSTWPANRLVVLTYHRIDQPDGDGRYPGLVSATPDEFAAQMTVLTDRYQVVSISDVLAARTGGAELPERAVLLTFDDAVVDFWKHALPVLESLSLPAVVFVPTGYVDRPDAVFWWDALHAALTTTDHRGPVETPIGLLPLDGDPERRMAYRRLRDHCMTLNTGAATRLATQLCATLEVVPPTAEVMGWEQLRELGRRGVSCAPHTRSHAHLDHIPIDDVRTEVAGSFHDLRAELDDVAAVFAYPAGRVTEEVQHVVRDAGIELAFTTARGVNDVAAQDPMTFRRINVSRTSGFGTVRAQMLPAADRLRR